MRQILPPVGILIFTLALLAGLVHSDPFEPFCDGMDRLFGAPPKWTQVTNLYEDPRTQETTHGDDPVTSLDVLEQYWRKRKGTSRVVFFGNSQMHAISLASGEMPMSQPEKTYVDLVVDELQHSDPGELLYRLSSSGMSYPEVLWELCYMLSDADLRPGMVVLQMNYQALWTGGIRDSMLPMLRRPSFRAWIEKLAATDRPDAQAFAGALRRYELVNVKDESRAIRPENSGLTSIFSPQLTPGYKIETQARIWLSKLSPEQHRAALKESFENVLYRGRLYLLRLKPSTARSITGSRLKAARSSIDSIAAICTSNGVRLLLFNAPVNPTVSLYRTPEDRQSYHEFVAAIAANYHIPVFDFENSISAQYWGELLNGPDPLHMGRAAHQQMAKQVIEAINAVKFRN